MARPAKEMVKLNSLKKTRPEKRPYKTFVTGGSSMSWKKHAYPLPSGPVAPGINASNGASVRDVWAIPRHSIGDDVISETEDRGEGVGELHDGDGSNESGDGLHLGNCRSNDEGCIGSIRMMHSTFDFRAHTQTPVHEHEDWERSTSTDGLLAGLWGDLLDQIKFPRFVISEGPPIPRSMMLI